MRSKTFNEKLNSGETFMVVFSATWCMPCKMLSKTINDLKETHPEISDRIYKIDIDDDQELAEIFGIMSVPTIISVKNKQHTQSSGVISKDSIVSFFS